MVTKLRMPPEVRNRSARTAGWPASVLPLKQSAPRAMLRAGESVDPLLWHEPSRRWVGVYVRVGSTAWAWHW